MATISYKIFLDDDYSAQKDIKLYLEDKFREIKDGHPFKHKLPSMWPGPGDIWHLASKSSGQFIYAATVVRYIQSPKHRPNQRLDAILNLRPPFKDLPFTELDALYRHIISKAEDPSPVLDVLGFPVLYGEFNVTYVEKLLQLEEGDVEVMLADLQSLVMIDRKMAVFGEIKVKLLHKSLGDFLCDSQRAGELYMDLSVVRVQNITHLISAVSTTFKHNGLQALDSDMAPWLLSAHQLLAPIQQESCGTIHDLNCEKARYVSSDILQAALEFPTFDLVKQMHTDPARHQSRYGYLCSFLSYFLSFLRSVKDVQESARQIYLQQIRQYCEAVLYLLEDDLSNDSKAHFIYTYYHLLGPRLCQYFLEYLHVQQLLPLEGGTSFGYFICNISASAKVVTAGFARLLQNAAPNALHDSGHLVDPPKCHPNTRTAIIQTVFNWSSGTTLHEEMNAKPILWLKGGAGAGKSAIARSVAEQCSKEGLLLGTFFFGAGDATRNHVGRLVATQAYQLCIMLPEFRDAVTTLIEDDPLVFSRSITTQFTDLIIHPLSTILSKRSGTVKTPRLIIIDGVDECSANVDSQRDLLFTLQEVTSSTSLIRFLVCSRPESHLNNAFSSSCMANIHYKIFLDDNYSAQKDIELYLEDKFQEIKEGHTFKHKLSMMWPKPGVISNLADKSSGQFIYASTVIRYIESPRHRPDQRLDAILNLRPPFKDLPFTELDALYRHIISKAEDPSTVLDILCFPVLYGEFSVTYLEKILQLEEGDVEVILADLQSLVTIYRETTVFDPEIKVELLHKSLRDFLCDSQRAGDLYRDLSAVRVQHTAHLISAVSTTFSE
ncbi:hypothetical protein CPC08DRAFT_771035 [Agrocybe pediades]|nr:hypothetical protein CPC08DRAFT_771035 [Agrocybe pediades]